MTMRFHAKAMCAVLAGLLSIAGTARAADTQWDRMPWLEGKQLTLRAGYNTVRQYPHARAFERFAHRVEEKTGENVSIQTFPSQSLGDEAQMLQAVMLGTLDMAKVSTANISASIPEFGVFDLPYVFRSIDHMMAVAHSDVGKELLAKLEQ